MPADAVTSSSHPPTACFNSLGLYLPSYHNVGISWRRPPHQPTYSEHTSMTNRTSTRKKDTSPWNWEELVWAGYIFVWLILLHTFCFLKDSSAEGCVCGGEGFLSDYFRYVYQINHQLPDMIFWNKHKHTVVCNVNYLGCNLGNMKGALISLFFITMFFSRTHQRKGTMLPPTRSFAYLSYHYISLYISHFPWWIKCMHVFTVGL